MLALACDQLYTIDSAALTAFLLLGSGMTAALAAVQLHAGPMLAYYYLIFARILQHFSFSSSHLRYDRCFGGGAIV